MAAITIPNPIPAELVALSQEAIERRDQLLERVVAVRKAGLPDADQDAFDNANQTYKDLATFAKEVERHREAIKAPVLALGRQIDAVAKDATAGIDEQRRLLGVEIADWQAKENARREKLRREAEEEARRKEAELQRQAAAEQERLEREARERAELEALPGQPPEEVVVEPTPIVIAPKVAPAYVPPPVRAAVKTTTRKKAVARDAKLTPASIDGISLVKQWDEAVITTLLKAGKTVPGWELVDDTTVGAKGR